MSVHMICNANAHINKSSLVRECIDSLWHDILLWHWVLKDSHYYISDDIFMRIINRNISILITKSELFQDDFWLQTKHNVLHYLAIYVMI